MCINRRTSLPKPVPTAWACSQLCLAQKGKEESKSLNDLHSTPILRFPSSSTQLRGYSKLCSAILPHFNLGWPDSSSTPAITSPSQSQQVLIIGPILAGSGGAGPLGLNSGTLGRDWVVPGSRAWSWCMGLSPARGPATWHLSGFHGQKAECQWGRQAPLHNDFLLQQILFTALEVFRIRNTNSDNFFSVQFRWAWITNEHKEVQHRTWVLLSLSLMGQKVILIWKTCFRPLCLISPIQELHMEFLLSAWQGVSKTLWILYESFLWHPM